MNRFIKLTFIILALFVIILTMFVVVGMQEKQIISLIKGSIEKKIRTTIELENIDFSLLKRFPNASVELTDVLVKSVPDFNEADFLSKPNDTLLFFHKVYFEMKFADLIQKKHLIKELSFQKGTVYIYADKEGKNNYDFWVHNEQANDDSSYFNLQSFNLSDTHIQIKDAKKSTTLSTWVAKLKLKGSFKQDNILLYAKAKVNNNYYKTLNDTWLYNSDIELETAIHKQANLWNFSDCKLKLNEQHLLLNGDINENNIKVKASGKKVSITKLRGIVPRTYLNAFLVDYPEGHISFDSDISANSKTKGKLRINIVSELTDIKLNMNKDFGTATIYSGKITYTNGINCNARSTYIGFTDLNMSPGVTNSNLTFSGHIQNLKYPEIQIESSLNIQLNDLNDLLKIQDLKFTGGTASGHFQLGGEINLENEPVSRQIPCLVKSCNMTVLNANVEKQGQLFEFTTKLSFDKHLKADSTFLKFNNQELQFQGIVNNLATFCTNPKSTLDIAGEMNIDSLNLNSLSVFTESNTSNKSGRYKLDLNIRARKFVYNQLEASGLNANVLATNEQIRFSNLKTQIFNGKVEGNAIWSTYKDSDYNFRSNVQVEHLDINQLFTDLNNFSQDFITNENIYGHMSGNLDIKFDMDTSHHFLSPSLKVNSDINIENGELIDFAPLYSLSKYIDVKELAHIKFGSLQNNIEISNEKIQFPKMTIKSSAFDIDASGLHYFDNTFEYHLKIFLSDVLETKFKNSRKNNFEDIGEIVDEDQGHIGIPIVIKGNTKNFRVEYDKRSARNNFKSEFNKEKEELRSVIKDEFNKKEQDPEVENIPQGSTLIEWDETETETAEEDLNPVNNDQQTKKGVIIEWDDE